VRAVLFLACFLIGVVSLPRWICARPADALFDGEQASQFALADGVARSIVEHRGNLFYESRSLRFDGQSAIAINQMAILGLGQVVLEHPEKKAEYLPAIRLAADRLADPATLRYAAKVYGHHGIERMGPGEGHAYLGYVNLALGMARQIDPGTPHASLNDRLSIAFAERLAASSTGMIETYPGETWPPDVAAVAGSVGLNARVTGSDRSALLASWADKYATCAIDSSGYLMQRVKTGSCVPLDAPRGSGTAVASYFTSFAWPELSHRLYAALASQGRRTLFGFAGIREYAPGHTSQGDVNAGPILFGVSVGATGFALGAARANGDRELYRELYRTAHLFGVPVDVAGARRFATGGTLGNALLLAMLTARRP
jgi:hypothetical protein